MDLGAQRIDIGAGPRTPQGLSRSWLSDGTTQCQDAGSDSRDMQHLAFMRLGANHHLFLTCIIIATTIPTDLEGREGYPGSVLWGTPHRKLVELL